MKYNRLCVLIVTLSLLMLASNIAIAGKKLDDATILAIFDQANTTDIFVGRMGVKYGHSKDVRKLAEMVATDHVAVQQMGRDLAKKLNIIPTPPDNDTSVADQAKIIAQLQSKSGREFDKAYLHHELSFHQGVIDAINETLLPSITNKEFKSLVKKVLPGFKHHLAETRKVAKKLGVTH